MTELERARQQFYRRAELQVPADKYVADKFERLARADERGKHTAQALQEKVEGGR